MIYKIVHVYRFGSYVFLRVSHYGISTDRALTLELELLRALTIVTTVTLLIFSADR